MTTTGCQHDDLGSAPTGTVCKDCGANWTQILRDCPALRKPGQQIPDDRKSAVDDLSFIARRLKEIEEERNG